MEEGNGRRKGTEKTNFDACLIPPCIHYTLQYWPPYHANSFRFFPLNNESLQFPAEKLLF